MFDYFSDKIMYLRTSMNQEYFKTRILLISVFVLFTIIYCLISLVNHYQFKTFALDLGMFNQALYSFAHFKNAYLTLGIDGVEMPFLATHFSIILIFLSPLYYLFGSYALLVIQIAAILFGGYGVYLFAKDQIPSSSNIPLIILLQYLSIWGIFSALSFDFHCNVIGAMMVIWFIYFLEKRKLIQASIFLILVLLSTETMSIWALFIIIGLIIKNWKVYRKEYFKFEVPAAIICLIYGFVVIVIIMPSLQGAANNLQFGRYSHLGNSYADILLTIIQNPIDSITLLYKNTSTYPIYDGIKQELFKMVLVSGGIALLIRPVYLLMLIPIFAQKLISNDYGLWGINGQYSIEFVPILSFATINLIQHTKKYKMALAIFIVFTTLISSVSSLDHRVSKWYNKTNSRFYSNAHYKSDLDIKKITRSLMVIPADSKISVTSCLAPHLAFREKIYHFPIIKDADYIALVTLPRDSYPLSKEDFDKRVSELRKSNLYRTILDENNLIIFERIK